jgi:hypothetical protein
MCFSSIILLASRTDKSEGIVSTGEDIIWPTFSLPKSFSSATALLRTSVSVRIPVTPALSITMMQETLFSDITFVAKTTVSSGEIVMTSLLITSFISSKTRKEVVEESE